MEEQHIGLGDLACEVKGVETLLSMLQTIVEPRKTGDVKPTDTTVEYAFYSLGASLRHIADSLNAMEGKAIKAGFNCEI